MNIFVLAAGGCETDEFLAACGHIENFSSARRSMRISPLGGQLDYPDGHIEIDDRLTWFLGRLDERFGDRAFYVHLVYDPEGAASHMARSLDDPDHVMHAYAKEVLSGGSRDSRDNSLDFWGTANANIGLFLKDKTQKMTFRLGHAEEDFRVFWNRIGARGSLDMALREWQVRRPREAPSAMTADLDQKMHSSVSLGDPEFSPVALRIHGKQALESGRWLAAFRISRRLLELNPGDDLAVKQAAVALGKMRDLSRLDLHDISAAARLVTRPDSPMAYPLASRIMALYAGHPAVGNVKSVRSGLRKLDRLLDALGRQADEKERSISILANLFLPHRPWRERALDLCDDHELQHWVSMTGLERLRTLQEAGQGAVLVLCHLAAERVSTLMLSRLGFKLNSLEYQNRLANQGVKSIRDSVTVWELGGTQVGFSLRETYLAKKTLLNGGIFQLAGDGYRGGSDVEAVFMGRKRHFKGGFAALALSAKVQAFPVFCTLDGEGRVTMDIQEPLDSGDDVAPHDERVAAMVHQYASRLEAVWRKHPGNIVWNHIGHFFNPPPLENRGQTVL